MIKYACALLFIFICASCFAVDAVKSVPKSTPAPSPLQLAIAKLAADVTIYEATSGSLAVHQAAVAVLLPSTSAAQAAVVADQAALSALVGPVTPGPGPGPVATHVVSILAITDTATCPPCRSLQPTLDSLAAAGVPITYAAGSDQAVASKWQVSAMPTLIMLVDGAEPGDVTMRTHMRIVGFDAKVDATGKPVVDAAGHQAPKADLAAWYAATVAWVKQKYGG